MKTRLILLVLLLTAGVCCAVAAKPLQTDSKASAKSSASPTKKTPPKSKAETQEAPADSTAGETQGSAPDADTELQIAVQQAGNDHAALIRNLEDYLTRHPDSPRRAAIYRALVQSEMQAQNQKSALDYAEKVIAIQPDDSETAYVAITILEKMPDDASQSKAIDYDTRLIDRVSAANPETRPSQMTLEDWQSGRNKFMMSLYQMRGRMQRHLHKNDEAAKDLAQSFTLLPNAGAALNLGEIAEERKLSDEAVRQYAVAFMLAGQDQDELTVSRDILRLKMGNLWRQTHGTNPGLGDMLLAAFDQNKALAATDKPAARNQGVSDRLQFSLRHIDGSSPVKLADFRGKTVVLNFWTTWCSYCQTLASSLAEVRKKFAGRDDIVFLSVNTDDDEALVAPFLKVQKVDGTLIFADGLAGSLKLESVPTVIVLDRSGNIAYREQGFAPDGFSDILSGAITKTSAGSAQ